MGDKLRVGLLGCGRIAQLFHARVLAHLNEVALVALAEADAQRLAETSRLVPAAAAFTDYRDVLGRPDVEAVVICLPTGMHAAAATAAFAQGKHVYLEKPLAADLEEARGVHEAWRRSGKIGAIGFNFRFHPLYRLAGEQIQAGRIGEVIGVRSVFCAAARPLPAWKQARRTGGGVLLDLASHHIDLIAFLFQQDVREVSAMVRSVRSEEDTATLTLRLAGGLLAQGFVSMSAVEEDRFEVYGTAGKLVVDRYRGPGLEFLPPRRGHGRWERLAQGMQLLGQTPRRLWNILLPPPELSYRAALQAFVDAARFGRTIRPDLGDGYRNLRVIHAAEEAARTGRVVSVQEVLPEEVLSP